MKVFVKAKSKKTPILAHLCFCTAKEEKIKFGKKKKMAENLIKLD